MASTYTVRVIPDASGWSAKLESQIDPVSRKIAENLKRELQRAIRDGLNIPGTKTTAQGARMGRDFADAFSRTLKTKLEAAFRSLPEIKIDASSNKVDREVADIRKKLALAAKDIEIGVNDKRVIEQIDALKVRLRALSHNEDIRIRVDSRAALSEIESIKRSLDDNKRGNFIARAFDDLRNKIPLLDKVSNKLGDVGSQLGGFVGKFGLPYLIVSAISLIGPLTAGAAGALFGLAGAAGVAGLAFVGLKEQMEAGVGQGAQVRKELDAISREIGSLGRLAADAVGPGLNLALDTIRRALPGFSTTIARVGANLGAAANHVVFGLVTAFQRAQPLILQFSGYIESLAHKFEGFTLSKDFGTFLDYAGRELPKIGAAAGDLVKGIISIGQALSTLGENSIFALGGLGKVLGLLGQIASFKFGSDGNGIADKLGLTSIGGNLGNLLQPVGAVLKGVDLVQHPEDYNGASQKAQEGLIAAQKLFQQRQKDYLNASTGAANSFGASNGAYLAASQAAKATADQLAATTLQMRLQNDAAGLLKQSLDQLSGKNLGVAQSLNSFQTGLLGLDDVFKKSAFSSTALTDSAVAQRGALEALVQQAQAHAEAVGTQTGSTVAATAALQSDYAQIIANTGATGKQKDAILQYIQSIGAIPPVAPTELDVDSAAAVATVNSFKAQIAAIPKSKGVEIYVSTSGAEAAIQRFVSTPRTAYVQVQTLGVHGTSGGKQLLNAQGGIFDGTTKMYAAGGITGPIPKYAAGALLPNIALGPRAIYGEAGPEAYIPLANDSRRNRAQSLWLKTGQEIGMLSTLRAPGPAAMASAGSGGGSEGPVTVNVFDRDGSYVDRMRGEISRRESDRSLQSSGGSSSRIA